MRNILLIVVMVLCSLTVSSQSEQQINNLRTFAKTYGYIKYFHPSDEASDLDWNRFSIYGASQIEKCDSKDQMLTTLKELFGPIAPSANFEIGKQPSKFDVSIIKPQNPENYELAYWQHKGVSTGMMTKGRPYISVRVNRMYETENADRFGNVMTVIGADKYKKKEFRYSAWVKMEEGSTGTGNLWFRVDNSDGSMGFFDNMGARPIKSTEWRQYEIKGQVDSLAQSLFLGCFLQGKGKLYFDNVRLEYKEGNDWVNIPIKNSDFESEKLGSKTDGVQWTKAGNGYAFETGTAVKYEGEKAAVIEFLGDVKEEKGTPVFDYQPRFGELIEEEIGKNLFCQIPLVLYANKDHTFPLGNNIKLKSLKKEVEDSAVDPTQLSVRLGNVINTFNVFQHFYPYFDVVDVDWEAALEEALKRSFTDETDEDHLITLEKFTALLKDGHVGVRHDLVEFFTPPITWEWVEDKLIITHLFEESSELEIGDEVTHINKQNSQDYFKEVQSRISAGTRGWLEYKSNDISLFGPKDSKITLRVNGKVIALNRNKDFYRERRSALPKKESYQVINDSVFYLNLDLLPMDKINELLPQIKNYKSIICDMRGYPNGNHDFISHLLKSNDTTESWMQVPKISFPDQKNLTEYEELNWKMKAKEPYLGDKQIIFITDGRAISYAESFMGYIEGYDLATIIGQPTAGTNGNVNSFELPGGYRISWTGMKVVKHDGSQHHAIGVLPDIYLSKTIEGVKSGEDEFLSKAIDLTRQ
ncbi:C-terminal processing protease CtpA/Prc [Flavobacteriaceae bacterium MAR_2009_75]|nr:C-terminal processing protease CtpA/Prc [Flavobacteriaceae bacterium MAR_2009_75]